MRIVLLSVFALALAGQPSEDLLKNAEKAFKEKRQDEAIKLASQAIAKEPKNREAISLRAAFYEQVGKFPDAVADLNKLIELDKKDADAFQRRGSVHFKMAKFKESIADFDRYIELNPEAKVSHWQRGIAYYYAGQYADGRKQFEGYQNHDKNDVENAVWHFMCMARSDGIAKTRKAILPIGDDRRVPMRQVYDLYKGDLKPADVLAAAKVSRELFYAHLYVGIYYDLLGDKQKAFEHLDLATEKHRIGHYMWDVARVHRDLLAKELKKKAK